jgi:hypothetical protein
MGSGSAAVLEVLPNCCSGDACCQAEARPLRRVSARAYHGVMLLQRELVSVSAIRALAIAGRLKAVLDATDTPAVLERVAQLGADAAVSLYRGLPEERYAAIAPWLVTVDPATFDWLTRQLWSRPWGVFVIADAGLDTIRTQLRRFLTVQAPDGERWYFRFYDPRVLMRYLETCTADELAVFFGPIDEFALTDPSYRVLRLRPAAAVRPTAGLP